MPDPSGGPGQFAWAATRETAQSTGSPPVGPPSGRPTTGIRAPTPPGRSPPHRPHAAPLPVLPRSPVPFRRGTGEYSYNVGQDVLTDIQAELASIVQDADHVRRKVPPDGRRRRPRPEGVVSPGYGADEHVHVDRDRCGHRRFSTRLTTSSASSADRSTAAERSAP